MDPMDYVLHNQHHPRSATHYDPVHAASGPWVPHHHHSQSSPVYPWHSHASSMPHSFHHPLQPAHAPSSEPFHIAQNGGLPPPVPGFHAGPPSDNFPGPIPPRHFHITAHRTPGSLQGVPGGHMGTPNDGVFLNQLPGGRPLSFQTSGGLGMPPAGNNPEPNSLPRPTFPLSDLPASNNFAQHSNPNLHFAIPQPPPAPTFNSSPPRRTHFSSTSPSARALREAQSPPRASQSSSSSRRSHHRARRSMSTRYLNFEPIIPDDDDLDRDFLVEHLISDSERPIPPPEQQAAEDAMLRHMQLARGVSTKLVASKSALRSLQSVNINDLPEAERTCVICYNDYGVETPEGINEAPLRLPKCKHVFGDHCIKKWFEDSDSCPYCRDKLHSEPKHNQPARAFMSMMRMRGIHVPPGLAMHADEFLIRAITTTTEPESTPSSRQNSTGGRRSPPDDAGEQQRRTRPRHSNSDPQESSTPNRPTSFERHASSRTEASPPTATYPQVPAPNRFSASRPSASTQRRSWAPSPVVGMPTSSTPETSRRLAQPSTTMSPSAPTFYPRGSTEMANRQPNFFTAVGEPQASSTLSISSRPPNSLPTATNVSQTGQQRDISDVPESQQNVAHQDANSSASSHITPGHNPRNRPW